MKSPSRPAQKGEPKHQDRRSSWLDARGHPKAGRRLHKRRQILATPCLQPKKRFPASRELLKKADLAIHISPNEISQPLCVEGEPKHQDRRFSWLDARGQPKAERRLRKRRPTKLTVCAIKSSTQEAIPQMMKKSVAKFEKQVNISKRLHS